MRAPDDSPKRGAVWRRLLLVPPLALGLAFLVWQIRAERGPEVPAIAERVTPVEVFIVAPTTLVPRAIGYGTVEPGRTFRAIAEIPGRVVERHPLLVRGSLLPAGTLVARIERADYELMRTRAEAEIRRLEALVEQLDVRRANLERSLEIEERAERLAEDDLERQRALRARGSTSAAVVDQAETALLAQRDQVQTVRANLAELDPEIAISEADIAFKQAELRQAELDLERTEIYLPFDARVAEVEVETGEYVQPGAVLATFDSIDRAEVDAQFALSQLRPLIPADLELPALDLDMLRGLPEWLGLSAQVRLEERDVDVVWPARFDRPSDRIDPQTRTLGLIVAVDDPYGDLRPGQRPPLTKGMFVEVVLEGQPQRDSLVVPIEAIHGLGTDPHVWLADDEDRLRRRSVELASVAGDLAVIDGGLEPGDRVVMTALRAAVDGMRLEPTPRAPLTANLSAAQP